MAKFDDNPDKCSRWLNTPNPDLSDFTPLQVIEKGKADAVADMVSSALLGRPAEMLEGESPARGEPSHFSPILSACPSLPAAVLEASRAGATSWMGILLKAIPFSVSWCMIMRRRSLATCVGFASPMLIQ